MNEPDPAARAAVERFAAALDADDLSIVDELLAPDCRYVTGDVTHRGSRAVAASYQQGSARARRLFDRVLYRHSIEATGAMTFRVDFADELTLDGETLAHHSLQDVTVDTGGRVCEILDVTGADERARVDAFLARHGRRR